MKVKLLLSIDCNYICWCHMIWVSCIGLFNALISILSHFILTNITFSTKQTPFFQIFILPETQVPIWLRIVLNKCILSLRNNSIDLFNEISTTMGIYFPIADSHHLTFHSHLTPFNNYNNVIYTISFKKDKT